VELPLRPEQGEGARQGEWPHLAEAGQHLPPGPYFKLVVEDNGPGIAPELLARVFDPFFTTKAPGEGTGLGLAVVHGIATGLGGDISARNLPGQGTRFTVLLPASGLAACEEAAPPPLRQGGRGQLFFVDDEADIRELASQSLAPLGYTISTFERAEDALNAFRLNPGAVHLVITDQSMPGLSGMDLAQKLRDTRPELPIIVSSGHSDALPLDLIQSLGQVWLLPKPYSMGELAESIRQALCKG